MFLKKYKIEKILTLILFLILLILQKHIFHNLQLITHQKITSYQKSFIN